MDRKDCWAKSYTAGKEFEPLGYIGVPDLIESRLRASKKQWSEYPDPKPSLVFMDHNNAIGKPMGATCRYITEGKLVDYRKTTTFRVQRLEMMPISSTVYWMVGPPQKLEIVVADMKNWWILNVQVEDKPRFWFKIIVMMDFSGSIRWIDNTCDARWRGQTGKLYEEMIGKYHIFEQFTRAQEAARIASIPLDRRCIVCNLPHLKRQWKMGSEFNRQALMEMMADHNNDADEKLCLYHRESGEVYGQCWVEVRKDCFLCVYKRRFIGDEAQKEVLGKVLKGLAFRSLAVSQILAQGLMDQWKIEKICRMHWVRKARGWVEELQNALTLYSSDAQSHDPVRQRELGGTFQSMSGSDYVEVSEGSTTETDETGARHREEKEEEQDRRRCAELSLALQVIAEAEQAEVGRAREEKQAYNSDEESELASMDVAEFFRDSDDDITEPAIPALEDPFPEVPNPFRSPTPFPSIPPTNTHVIPREDSVEEMEIVD